MSNSSKSRQSDEAKADELLPDDDFSLAALDFLSADLGAPGEDFFDTGALTSLASLDWRDTNANKDTGATRHTDSVSDDAISATNLPTAVDKGKSAEMRASLDTGAAAEPPKPMPPSSRRYDTSSAFDTGSSGKIERPAVDLPDIFTQPTMDDEADALLEMVESLTSPSIDVPADEDGLMDLAESFTSPVPDDVNEDDLLELAESFTQGTPEASSDDAALIDLAETFAATPETSDDTIVMEDSAEVKAAREEALAEVVSEKPFKRVEEPAPVVEEIVIPEKLVADPITELAAEAPADDMLAEAALEAITEDSESALAEEAIDVMVEETIEETSDLIKPVARVIDEPLVDPFTTSDEALEALLAGIDKPDAATNQAFDALLGESSYLDQMAAMLDSEAAVAPEDETKQIELLTAREANRTGQQFIIFSIDDSEYGIPISNVLEVGEPIIATPVPFVPEWMSGVINLRGEVVSLVDLRGFLHGTKGRTVADPWMIISQTKDEAVTVGLLVDDVRGNRNFNPEQATAVGDGVDQQSTRYVDKIFNDGGKLVAALDFERLLHSAEMRQFEAL